MSRVKAYLSCRAGQVQVLGFYQVYKRSRIHDKVNVSCECVPFMSVCQVRVWVWVWVWVLGFGFLSGLQVAENTWWGQCLVWMRTFGAACMFSFSRVSSPPGHTQIVDCPFFAIRQQYVVWVPLSSIIAFAYTTQCIRYYILYCVVCHVSRENIRKLL